MLTHLQIRNFTLIEALDLNLDPGLIVFTGETGAGKSILLDALMLLLGGRADVDAIREGCDELEVSARFDLAGPTSKQTADFLEAAGLPAEDNTLIVRRIVAHSGKHRQWINGSMATVSQLRQVMMPLVDFTSQHAQLTLLRAKGQLELLDAFGQHEPMLDQMREAHRDWVEVCRTKNALADKQRERESQIEWLQFQIQQIDRIAPKPEEFEELRKEREKLASMGKVKQLLATAQSAMGQDNGDALAQIQRASQALLELAQIDEKWSQLGQALVDAAAIVDDVSRELSKTMSRLEADPDRLEKIDDRLDELKQLLRKHGPTTSDLFAKHAKMKGELEELEQSEDRLAAMAQQEQEALAKAQKIANMLSESRKVAAKRFAQMVAKEIKELGMPEAVLDIQLTKTSGLSSDGSDQVQLTFSANPGEPPLALEKVASGGELSRVMLAIKRVLLQKDRTLVSIFDEVDAGVGGAIGEAIGEKLQQIATGRQVLCVTHLPQVAARAHAHMRVEKEIRSGRTYSQVTILDRQSRIEELARMMAGKQITELSRKHAEQFLEQANV